MSAGKRKLESFKATFILIMLHFFYQKKLAKPSCWGDFRQSKSFFLVSCINIGNTSVYYQVKSSKIDQNLQKIVKF